MFSHPSFSIVFRVILPFSLGYFLSYVFRTINAVIAPNLVRDVGLTADGLGLLSGVYFLTFAICQLPVGYFLDNLGPRKTEVFLLIIAAIGSILFAFAQTIPGLILGRALIGIGVSACLMASFKAFAIWFPGDKLPLINGLVLMAGGVGAMTATAPIEYALQFTGWRELFIGLGVLAFSVSIILYYMVPESDGLPNNQPSKTVSENLSDLKLILKQPIFYRFLPIVVFSQASFLASQTLWIGPWMKDVAGLDRSEIANNLLVTAIAMTLGYLLLGWMATVFNKWGYRSEKMTLVGITIFMLIQAILIIEVDLPVALTWGLFAFFGTSGAILFASFSQYFGTDLVGRAITMMNLLIFVFAFVLQWLIGIVITIFSSSYSDSFSSNGYAFAFSILLGLQFLGLGWFWISRFDFVKWLSK